MKKLILALAILCSGTAFAQNPQPSSLANGGCGTVTTPAEIAAVYDFVQHNPEAYAKPSGQVDTIALAVHIVGNDNSVGFYQLNTLFSLICKLNQDFAPANMYFGLTWPINYISNTSYYVHDWTNGAQMMASNNVPGAANVYFVQDPAGACGYYSSWVDGVAIAKSCASANSTTVTHELGHFFSLPHTFYGWEGGNTPANPELVTRGPGANCNTAGDGFCDTDADYISERWYCPYTGNKVDANGQSYHPDSSNYMSYALDACMTRFSPMQIAKMHNNLNGPHNNLITSFGAWTPLYAPSSTLPFDSVVYASQPQISWTPVVGAQQYYVRVSPRGLPAIVKQEAVVSDTFLNLTFSLLNGANYQFNVAPLSSINLCRQYTLTDTFQYSNTNAPTAIAGVHGAVQAGITLLQNPVKNGVLELSISQAQPGTYGFRLLNQSGQCVAQQELQVSNPNEQVRLNVPGAAPGLYYLLVNTASGQQALKVLVQ